jgi:hypothetical protein
MSQFLGLRPPRILFCTINNSIHLYWKLKHDFWYESGAGLWLLHYRAIVSVWNWHWDPTLNTFQYISTVATIFTQVTKTLFTPMYWLTGFGRLCLESLCHCQQITSARFIMPAYHRSTMHTLRAWRPISTAGHKTLSLPTELFWVKICDNLIRIQTFYLILELKKRNVRIMWIVWFNRKGNEAKTKHKRLRRTMVRRQWKKFMVQLTIKLWSPWPNFNC